MRLYIKLLRYLTCIAYNRKKKNSIPKINAPEHFNIINDIKINENNNNIDINSNEQILDIDLVKLFGDDIKIQNYEKENKEINNDNITTNNSTNNNIEQDKKENENVFSNIELNDVSISFFDSLKDEMSNKKSPQKKFNNNLTIPELAEEIKLKQNNPDFREELKKKGLNFTLVDKNENENYENNENSFTNVLSCPICFNNTKNQNIKMEVCGCGHWFCKNCLDRIEKENKKPKCPICKRNLKLKERRILFV